MNSLNSVLKTLLLGLVLAYTTYYLLNHISRASTMPAKPSARDVSSALLASQGLHLTSLKVIQSLWAGYGQICLLEASPNRTPTASPTSSRTTSTTNSNLATPQESQTFILKLITPPPASANDEGHTRKILSYQVEQYFYTHLAPQLPASIPVAKCIASINQKNADGTSTTAMVLENLRDAFPVAGEKRAVLSAEQVGASIDWLANFHAFWRPRITSLEKDSLVLPPLDHLARTASHDTSVWLNGGYTYLATRATELTTLRLSTTSEWRRLTTPIPGHNHSLASLAAAFLSPLNPRVASALTLLHGDVKSENLFATASGDRVAFYDFQYVGLGLGVADLAKLFTCSVALDMLVADAGDVPRELGMGAGEKALLRRYWGVVVTGSDDGSGEEDGWETFVLQWEVALVDWLRFQAGWGFWGNTAWLEARVRWILGRQGWVEKVASLVGGER